MELEKLSLFYSVWNSKFFLPQKTQEKGNI